MKIYAAGFGLFLLALPLALVADTAPDQFWNAKLWLSGQALGLSRDCPVQTVFRGPGFRQTQESDGSIITYRLVSQDFRGSDLLEVIDAFKDGERIARTSLALRYHPAEDLVSIQHIELENLERASKTVLDYDQAVTDDDEYDRFTDAVVDLYRTFKNPEAKQ